MSGGSPAGSASLAAAEALEAIEADRACWTWQLWGQPLLHSDRGPWTLEVLSRFFGPDYLHRPSGRPPAGLFDQALVPQLGQDRVDRVVELATRLASVSAQTGADALAAEAAADTQPSYFAHLQALLAVAAPLATDGWALDLYPINPPAGDTGSLQRPAPDLRAQRAGVSFAVEVKCLGEDDQLRATEQFTDRVQLLKIGLEQQIGHGLDVFSSAMCDDEELDRWAAEILDAAARNKTTVSGPGSGHTLVHRDPGGLGSLTGPALTKDLWGRLASAVHRAGRQLRLDGRGWAVVQDNGSLPWATLWSRNSLTGKLNDLITPVRRELGRSQLAGVVITTGPRNEASPVPEEDAPGPGCIGLRRQLVGRRSRETFIICASALHGPSRGLISYLPSPDAQALYNTYANEGAELGSDVAAFAATLTTSAADPPELPLRLENRPHP